MATVDGLIYLVAILGVSLIVCTTGWFYVWLGLEFSILAFVGYMSTRGENYQKLITYFVAQVFGRFVLLVGVLGAGV